MRLLATACQILLCHNRGCSSLKRERLAGKLITTTQAKTQCTTCSLIVTGENQQPTPALLRIAFWTLKNQNKR